MGGLIMSERIKLQYVLESGLKVTPVNYLKAKDFSVLELLCKNYCDGLDLIIGRDFEDRHKNPENTVLMLGKWWGYKNERLNG